MLAACYSSNAQFFAGGGFNISSNSTNSEGGLKTVSGHDFQIRPKVGYFFSDKFAVGLGLNINPSSSEAVIVAGKNTTTTVKDESAVGFVPFVRYYFAKYKSFSMFVSAEFTIQSGSSKSTVSSTNTNETIVTDNTQALNTAFVISPSISYSINEHFNLEAAINFLNFGISRTTLEQTTAGVLEKETNSSVNFGANMDGFLNTNNISISAIYKF